MCPRLVHTLTRCADRKKNLFSRVWLATRMPLIMIRGSTQTNAGFAKSTIRWVSSSVPLIGMSIQNSLRSSYWLLWWLSVLKNVSNFTKSMRRRISRHYWKRNHRKAETTVSPYRRRAALDLISKVRATMPIAIRRKANVNTVFSRIRMTKITAWVCSLCSLRQRSTKNKMMEAWTEAEAAVDS